MLPDRYSITSGIEGGRGDRDVWRFRSVPRGIVTAIRIVSRRAKGRFDWTWSQLRRAEGAREEGSGFDRRIALSLSEEGAVLKSRVGVAWSPTPKREQECGKCGWMEWWKQNRREDVDAN